MNNLLSFWLAPITALFHPCVYRDASKRSGWRGVLYVLYLSLITGVLTLVLMLGMLAPVADEFVAWAQKNMPVMIWTPEGLSLENGQTTFLLVHPQYGPVVAFDMTKTSATEADMKKVYILVTATKIFVKRGPGDIEGRDITKAGIQTTKQLPPKIRITGAVVRSLFKVVKNAALMIIPPLIAGLSFSLILVINLLYSLVGLLFNMMRKQKLRYGAIFSLTCFATTVSLTLMWIKVMSPLRSMPWPLAVSIGINLIYMFFAFKITDSDNSKAKV